MCFLVCAILNPSSGLVLLKWFLGYFLFLQPLKGFFNRFEGLGIP